MTESIDRVLVSEEQIQQKVNELAAILSEEYAGKDPVFVGVLKGVVMFFGDMVKRITVPCQIDFMWISSYGSGTKSGGKVNIVLDLLRQDLETCDILIVEDIIDSGRTLSYLCNYLTLKGAKSVKTVTLLDKPSRREVEFTPDYHGLEVPDYFVVGYGLDYNERYRALPYVGILKPEVYTKH